MRKRSSEHTRHLCDLIIAVRLTQVEALEQGVPGPQESGRDVAGREIARPWQHMQMNVPDLLGVQAEMDALGGKHLCKGHRRAAHHLPRCGCLLSGQCPDVLTMAFEHNESLARHEQRSRPQEDHPMRVTVHYAA